MASGGKRTGAGRKKGSKSPRTIERDLAFRELRERVIRSKDSLINSQMAIAKGLTFLYVIRTVGKGKDRKRLKPKIVDDQATIEAYLADELDNDENEYYFMSTQRPDNKAIDSLLDRTFHKATQPIGGDPDSPIQVEHITGMRISKDDDKKPAKKK